MARTWTRGGPKSRLGWLIAVPFVAILAVLGMLGVGIGGGSGAPANEYADEQQRQQQAAEQVQACATGATAAPTTTGAAGSVSSTSPSSPPTSSAPSTSAASGSPASSSAPAPGGPLDSAVVAAQGVPLTPGQISAAQTIVAAARAVSATDRQVASTLLAAYHVTQLSSAVGGKTFGGKASTLTAAIGDYLAALRKVDPDGSAAAIADVTAKALAGKADVGDLRPLGQWSINLAGYLITGRSAVAVSNGQITCAPAPSAVGGQAGWDPGNIASDAVFYNGTAMTEAQIRSWIAGKGAACIGDCLARLTRDLPAQPADAYCKAITGGRGLDAAAIIYRVSAVCGVNPQVMLVTLEKESGGVTASTRVESSWAAAWGWHCPDTGPGGSANCDPTYSGFVNQAYGMAKQWRRYVVDAGKYNYHKGQTVDIMWNVAETGCGAAPVTIKTDATAALYNYTPYQPNAASLAGYPGEGDQCSSYGNRNFFFMFQKWFGTTGGGITNAGGVQVGGKGLDIQLPTGSPVQGIVHAPTANAAAVIRTALSQLGLPYVWAGGDANGPTVGDNETGEIGFDCSGLMIYAYAQIGVQLTHYSGAQSQSGTQKPYAQVLPGDLLFWGGSNIHHVAMYLGVFDGVPYMVEAPQRGTPVRVSPVRLSKSDWNGVAVTPADGGGTAPAGQG